jgi:hypothetical protein
MCLCALDTPPGAVRGGSRTLLIVRRRHRASACRSALDPRWILISACCVTIQADPQSRGHVASSRGGRPARNPVGSQEAAIGSASRVLAIALPAGGSPYHTKPVSDIVIWPFRRTHNREGMWHRHAPTFYLEWPEWSRPVYWDVFRNAFSSIDRVCTEWRCPSSTLLSQDTSAGGRCSDSPGPQTLSKRLCHWPPPCQPMRDRVY